jgi:transcriptional regulator with XRE-family HTH domain
MASEKLVGALLKLKDSGKISQAEIARRAGVAPSTISKILKNRSYDPGEELLGKLAAILDNYRID